MSTLPPPALGVAIRMDRARAGGVYSFVACLSRLTIDHASLSRRSTVPTPSRDTSKGGGSNDRQGGYLTLFLYSGTAAKRHHWYSTTARF